MLQQGNCEKIEAALGSPSFGDDSLEEMTDGTVLFSDSPESLMLLEELPFNYALEIQTISDIQ